VKNFWKEKKFSFKAWSRIGAVNCKSGIFVSRPIPEWAHWQGEQFSSVCSLVHSWLCRIGAKLDITPKLRIKANRRVLPRQGFGVAEDKIVGGGKGLVRFIQLRWDCWSSRVEIFLKISHSCRNTMGKQNWGVLPLRRRRLNCKTWYPSLAGGILELVSSQCSLLGKEIAVVARFPEALFFSTLFWGDLDILLDRIVKIIPVFFAQSLCGDFLFELSFLIEYAYRIKHISLSSSPQRQLSGLTYGLDPYQWWISGFPVLFIRYFCPPQRCSLTTFSLATDCRLLG